MRATQLWLAVLALAGCAHRSGTEPAPESQAQALSREAHPSQEIAEIEAPAPPAAAQTPSGDESQAAQLERAEPPPRPTVAGEAQLETTAHLPDAPLTPPEPAASDVITAPAPNQAPPVKLGAEISRADVELRERVQRALLNAPSLSYTAKRVRVDVAKREVTLRGEVRTAHERKELEQIVRSLPGVKQLNNQVALIEPATRAAP